MVLGHNKQMDKRIPFAIEYFKSIFQRLSHWSAPAKIYTFLLTIFIYSLETVKPHHE